MSREIFETRATYNICSDRLKVWFKTADRLPRPEYEQAKRIGFVWWPGSNCLTCVWRPDAADFITSRGIEIEEDDQPDDTEARVERFTKYANSAEQSATGAADYLDSGRANTDRRRRLALARAENETDRAGHWNRRIEAAIRHASFKERPDVIARRIEGLETDLRRHVASYTPHRAEDGRIIGNGEQVIVGPKGRGAHAVDLAKLPQIEAYARRWTEHIEDRLLYERAALAAAGGLQAQIASAERKAAEFLTHSQVNPSTVEIYNPGCLHHVKHAFTFLRPGGRLVAVVCNPIGEKLRGWADERGGWVEQLPDDTFRNSERSTGVRTSLVVANAV